MVPITTVPRFFVSDLRFSISGVMIFIPAFIASAAAITCGRKRDPCSNCSPTSSMPAVYPFSISSTGSIPAARASSATSAAISSSNSVIASFAFAMISSLLAIFRSPDILSLHTSEGFISPVHDSLHILEDICINWFYLVVLKNVLYFFMRNCCKIF